MDKHTSICITCGKPFTSKPSQHRKYCSLACYNRFRDNNAHTTICANCGKQFRSRPYDQLKFCSNKCFGESERVPKIVRVCEVCGKTFERLPRKKQFSHNYCSNECKWIGNGICKSGRNSHLYRGGMTHYRGLNWKDQRKKAVERDGYKCQICHKQLGKKVYDYAVHHIKSYKEFNGDYVNANKLINLITLCRRCHGKVEHGNLACPRPLF